MSSNPAAILTAFWCTAFNGANVILPECGTDAWNVCAAVAGKKSVRKYPNGFIVETVALGNPAAKLAKPGKKIAVKYTGRLASNGKVFDSTKGSKTFSFRLGVGEVIKGCASPPNEHAIHSSVHSCADAHASCFQPRPLPPRALQIMNFTFEF